MPSPFAVIQGLIITIALQVKCKQQLTSTNRFAEEDQNVEMIFLTALAAILLSFARSVSRVLPAWGPPSESDLSWPRPGDSDKGAWVPTNPSHESEAV